MNKFRRFAAFLNIKPGEERLIGLLLLLAFTLELSFVLLQSMAFGVFIDEYGPQALPYSYITNAVVASLVAVLYIKLGERVSFSKTLIINLVSLGTSSLLIWLGLKSIFSHYVSFILPPLYQIVTNLGYLAIWQLAAHLFDFQQAKRLFPLLITGPWFASICGGLLVQPLVDWIGPINLLLLSAVIIGLALLVLRTITRTYLAEQPPSLQPHSPVGRAKQTTGFLQNRYVLLIFAYLSLWWLAFYVLDNIFADRVAAQFPDVNQLTVFMGRLAVVTGIVAILSSTLLSSWIIGRFGVRAGLISESLIVTILLGLLIISGNVGSSLIVVVILVALARLINVAFGFSVSQSALGLVYLSLPDTIRGRVQTTAEAVFQPIASGMAGICLIVLTAGLKFNYLGLSVVYLTVATGLLIVILLLSGGYVKALTDVITKRRLGESPMVLADPVSISLLRSRLHDPHPGVVIYALTKLESLDGQTIITELPKLIRHPAPEARREAFLRIEKLRPDSLVNEVQHQLSVESDSWVKEVALRALGAIAKGESFSLLTNALHETDGPSLRGALVGLLKYGDHATAKQKLDSLLASASNEDRILAIRVLGELNRSEYYPHLISAGDSRDTSQAAERALASIGADALAQIEKAFSQPEAPRQRLYTLIKALGHIGGSYSHRILLSRLSTSDEELRSQILNALSQSSYRTKDVPAIERAVKTEVEQAAWYCATQVDLSQVNESALLVAALEESLGQSRDRVLLLLSFVFNGDSIRRAREAFLFGSASQFSYALEIMDTQLPSEWKGWVMPLLEELSPQERSQRFAAFFPQAMQTPEERLCEIIDNGRFLFWVQACAAYTHERLFPAAQKGDPAMLSTVEKVLILKTVSMFSQTPDNVLADVADLLQEDDISKNETIFHQGDPGDSLYVILDGKVRVHDGEQLLNYLGERDVFGEMALLDPEPRLASVTAVEPTRLFRLDQVSFFQLMAERPEVAMGIIRVLTSHLRNRVRDIAQLKAQIKELETIKPVIEQE